MRARRIAAGVVGGLLGGLICLMIVFTTAQGGWWLAPIPATTAIIGALFGDNGVHFLARLIGM